MRHYFVGTGGFEWVLSPDFNLSNGGYEINFDIALTPLTGSAATSLTQEYQLRLVMSETPGVWTTLNTWDVNNSPSNTGDSFNVALTSTGANVKFGFLATEGTVAGTGANIYVDNFQIRTIPTCPEVSNLTVDSVTTTTATISFDSNNATSSGNFEYALVPVGDPAPTGTGIAISDPANATSSYSFIIGDGNTTGPALAASTSYDLYVREICSVGDESNYSLIPVTFSTECDTFSSPYFTDFENFTPDLDFTGQNCWTEISTTAYDWEVLGSGGTTSSSTGPDGAFSGDNFIAVDASDGANGDTAVLRSPIIDLTGLSTPALSFYYHMYGQAITSLEVGVSTDNGATFTNVLSIVGQQQTDDLDPWIEQVVNLSAYANQEVMISFETMKGSGTLTFEGDVSLDDFRIDELPTCPSVSMLAASNITTTTADVSFTSQSTSSAGNFEYVVVSAGAAAPTGAGISLSDATVTNGMYNFTIGNGTTTAWRYLHLQVMIYM